MFLKNNIITQLLILHRNSSEYKINNIMKLDKKYSVGKILESLKKCNCQNLEENIYRFNFYNPF